MQVDLSGKVALVTGAARNIGKAIADAFASNGARVLYADILADEARSAAAAHEGCAALQLDVSDGEAVAEAMRAVERDHGGLDILVNNAGVNTMKHRVTVEQFPREEWDWIMSVDLDGVFLVSRAAVPLMLARGGGRIINIASVFGLVPARLQCAYVAAKAGVVNLTRAMALELAPRGILVNAIAPGSIMSEGTRGLFYGKDGLFADRMRQMIAHIPVGRPGEPEDIAWAALYLAAPESRYVNGHVLAVDGGWTAGYTREF